MKYGESLRSSKRCDWALIAGRAAHLLRVREESVATLLDGLRAKVGKHDSRPAANNMGTSVVALYTAREQTTGG